MSIGSLGRYRLRHLCRSRLDFVDFSDFFFTVDFVDFNYHFLHVLLRRGCLLGHEANSCWLGYFQVVVWNMLWLGFTQHHIAFLVGFSLFVIGCGGWLYWSILVPYRFCSISKDFYFASWYVGEGFWKEWMEIRETFGSIIFSFIIFFFEWEFLETCTVWVWTILTFQKLCLWLICISKVMPLNRFAAKSCLLWMSVVEATAGDYCLEWQ